uniref:Dirigent protein n=1 Tax=Panagrellus redivivus TaxID=6233 RepID=A0A7E5A023_PANRE
MKYRLSVLSFTFLAILSTTFAASRPEVKDAVRIVRFQVDYPHAQVDRISDYTKWTSLMRKSVLASLRFINKHWNICAAMEEGKPEKKDSVDCGKLQVTGEIVRDNFYRINATFIAERDPIRNTNVDATSTVFGVVQIGLRGGIFQYTNALKVLGKPSSSLAFEEAFFCYPGYSLSASSEKCLLDASDSSRRRVRRATKTTKKHKSAV